MALMCLHSIETRQTFAPLKYLCDDPLRRAYERR